MRGLLDSDILPYEFGAAKDEAGDELPLNLTIARMYERIEKIQDRSGVHSLEFYLTGEGNFRKDIATIKPYKGHRPEEKSRWWAALRHELITNCNAIVVEGMEADDAVSIEQYKDFYKSKSTAMADGPCIEEYLETVILSRDKDLSMVPGWHYGWEAGYCKEKPLWYQNETDGLRCFYKQCLTGDSTDNILGLFGVGGKSTLVSALDSIVDERSMYEHVLSKYQDRFGSYAEAFLLENGRLLWMLQYEGQLWQGPIDTQVKQQNA